jgi:uncharacterized protein YraI
MLTAAKRLALSLAIAAGIALAAGPVLANSDANISTRAFTNHNLAVYESGDRGAAQIGLLPGGLPVAVNRCSGLWCNISVGRHHGWVFLYSLSFGAGPNSVWTPKHFWW